MTSIYNKIKEDILPRSIFCYYKIVKTGWFFKLSSVESIEFVEDFLVIFIFIITKESILQVLYILYISRFGSIKINNSYRFILKAGFQKESLGFWFIEILPQTLFCIYGNVCLSSVLVTTFTGTLHGNYGCDHNYIKKNRLCFRQHVFGYGINSNRYESKKHIAVLDSHSKKLSVILPCYWN